jgi:hypothetical protein
MNKEIDALQDVLPKWLRDTTQYEYVSKDPLAFFEDQVYHWVMMNALGTAGQVLRNARIGKMCKPDLHTLGDHKFLCDYFPRDDQVLGFVQTYSFPLVGEGEWASKLRDSVHKEICSKLDFENNTTLGGISSQLVGNDLLITYTFKQAWVKCNFLGDLVD